MEIDYQHVFEQMPTPYVVLDSALRVVAVNDGYLAATMTTRSELLGRNVFASFPTNPLDASAGDPNNLRASLEKVLRTGERDTMAVQRYDIPDGEGFVERYWSPVNAPVIGGDGSVVLLLHRVEDVTGYIRERQSGDHERIKALLSRRADSLEADLSARAGALQDANRRLQDARRGLEGVASRQAALARLGQLALGGTSIADLAEEVASTMLGVDNVDVCEVLQVLPGRRSLRVRARAGWPDDSMEPAEVPLEKHPLGEGALLAANALVDADIRTDARSGRAASSAPEYAGSALAVRIGDTDHPFGVVVAYSRRAAGLTADDGHFAQSVANVLATAVERASREEAMRHQALHDGLTGLPNRQLLLDRLERALAACQRQESSGALVLLDLDGFKEVNDSWGHHVGDGVLQQIAVRLRDVLRDSDTVARLGGDEFALLLPGLQTFDEVKVVIDKIQGALSSPLRLPEGTARVAGSLGVVLFPMQGDDAHVLLQRADMAMYCAKRSGGGYAVHGTAKDHQRATPRP